MQSDPCKYKSLLPATATIIREEGAQALVKGLGPTLVGYGVEGALKFGVYEVSKPLVVAAFSAITAKLKLKSGSAGALPFLLASIAAGAIASVVLVSKQTYCCFNKVLDLILIPSRQILLGTNGIDTYSNGDGSIF